MYLNLGCFKICVWCWCFRSPEEVRRNRKKRKLKRLKKELEELKRI